MKCPRCDGGTIFGMFPVYADSVPQDQRKPVVAMTCFLCGGTNEVDDGYPHRQTRGEAMRSIRINHDLSLREFAKEFHFQSSTVSEFELGRMLNDEITDALLVVYLTLDRLAPIDPNANELANENTEGIEPLPKPTCSDPAYLFKSLDFGKDPNAEGT